MDVPVTKVLIEAGIVIVTDTFSKELGTRFGVTQDNTDNSVTTAGSNMATSEIKAITFQIAVIATIVDMNTITPCVS